MAKKKRREKSIAEYDADVDGKRHIAKRKLPHLAMELQERGDLGGALNLTRTLRRRHARAVVPLNVVQESDYKKGSIA